MTVQNVDIQPLFATPIFRASIADAISPEQVEFIKNLKMLRNKQNQISENLYIFELPELKSIKDAVQEALDVYANQVMGISQKLYVTQSWSLINHPNVGMHAHSHSNSIISGSLYYAELPEPSSRMIFERYTMHRQIQIDPENDKRNLFNTPANVVTPKTGEVVLFSSDLNHLVETNVSDQPRYSIAFNCFVKGTIGNFRDVSELTV